MSIIYTQSTGFELFLSKHQSPNPTLSINIAILFLKFNYGIQQSGLEPDSLKKNWKKKKKKKIENIEKNKKIKKIE